MPSPTGKQSGGRYGGCHNQRGTASTAAAPSRTGRVVAGLGFPKCEGKPRRGARGDAPGAGGDVPRGYDGRMCSHQEWESFRRRFQETVDEGELREFVADAVACIEAFVDELRSRACVSEDTDWVRHGCGRRSRTEWVA
jgi:hypothetical protein